MFAELLLATAFQVGPFYAQRENAAALKPLWSCENETTDVLWPLFTRHRDWWRFAFFVHEQDYDDGGWQFEIMPLWFNGCERTTALKDPGEAYWGLFPLWGHHPHIALIHDVDFALWPLYHAYTMPRRSEPAGLRTHSVLFPFIHWRSDGSWGFWPLYVCNRQRESYHQTALWPLFTWATYAPDRDTSGAGTSWMFWPLFGRVSRERETQTFVLPPLISHARTNQGWRGRYPWPLVDVERTPRRTRTSIFPFYERNTVKGYGDGEIRSDVRRFGWKLVELYDDETRVFPFWVSRKDDSYFRLWPFYESWDDKGVRQSRVFSFFPIRWVPAVDRNWASYWTFYERRETALHVDHSLFWGIIRWGSMK